MTRATPSQASRELDSITSSLVVVRVLHYTSAGPATAAGIAERLRQHGPARANQLLARMTRSGLLRAAPAPVSQPQRARKYLLTPKGRRLLGIAAKHLPQLAAPHLTEQNQLSH